MKCPKCHHAIADDAISHRCGWSYQDDAMKAASTPPPYDTLKAASTDQAQKEADEFVAKQGFKSKEEQRAWSRNHLRYAIRSLRSREPGEDDQ